MPARNPYLAIAGLLAGAYLGIRDELKPPAALEGYGYDPSKADRLPGDLATALDALEADTELADILGEPFVAMFLHLQAARARALQPLGDRLGVPRVRLPPVIVKDPNPQTKERDRVTTHARSAR